MAARDQLIASDLLVAEAGTLRVTRQGRLVLNRILTELLVTNAQGRRADTSPRQETGR